MDLLTVSLGSIVNINWPEAIDYFKEKINKKGRTLGISKVADILTKIVTGKDRNELWIFGGEFDFASAWLSRLSDEELFSSLSIERVVCVAIAPTKAKKLIRVGLLEKDFIQRMKSNLRVIERCFSKSIEYRYWNEHPLFHGFRFGNNLIIGTWQINRNQQLTWRTKVKWIKKKRNTENLFKGVIEVINNNTETVSKKDNE